MAQATEYASILHNLQQRDFVAYTESYEKSGPQHDLVWECWINVERVNPPFENLVPQGDAPVPFWRNARSRKEAKKQAAKNVLYAIGYYTEGQEDLVTPAGEFANQPSNQLPN